MGRPRKVDSSVVVIDREDTITELDEFNGAFEGDIEEARMKEIICEEPKHSDLIERIGAIQTPLNELDEYLESISSLQSQNDEYLSDLLHFVENEDIEFTPKMALRFVELLKEKRIKRRTLNNDWEIKRVYDTGRQRLGYANQRDMFMASIYKKEKELSCTYRYRQTSAEEIMELIK